MLILTAAGAGAVRAGVDSGRAMRLGSPSAKTPSLFVSPNGSDSGGCTRAAPCASWNAAYLRARPGQVIEVGGGTYPDQVIGSRSGTRNLQPGCTPATPANCIVFRPAAGARATISGSLQVNGSSVWVQGSSNPQTPFPLRGRNYSIKVTGYADTEATSTSDYPDHVVLQGIAATSFGVFGVHTALFRDMDIGPATVGAGCAIVEGPGIENKIGFAGGVNVVPTNVILDRLIIHNQNRNQDGANSDCHFGGLFLTTVRGLVIERSVFSQNAVYNLQVQNFNGAPPPTDVTIQNNWFGCPTEWIYQPGGDTQCDGQADIQFNAASVFANWLIRYNSFGGGVGEYVDGASYQSVRLVGNAGARPQTCFGGMTFDYNVWDGRRCAATDISSRAPMFRSTRPGAEDFRLVPGSRARSAVRPASKDLSLASDIQGNERPLVYPRDAGAVERDTARLVPGHSIGSVSIGMRRETVLEAYGQPRRSTTVRLGRARVLARVDLFTVPGGKLRVTTVNDSVAGLATTSPFYSTSSGIGIGSQFAEAARSPRALWQPCARALQLRVGPVVVSFKSTVAKRRITGVEMVRHTLAPLCDQQAKGTP